MASYQTMRYGANMLKIASNHPVRKAISAIGDSKWATKRHAFGSIQDILRLNEMQFDIDGPTVDITDDNGHIALPIHREGDNAEYGHMVVFSWYRYPSGQYEITTYVS